MTTGVESYNGTLGVTQAASIKDCASAKTSGTTSLWEIAEDAGMATGVISTARITHATPAATYAETTERDWESDKDVSDAGKAAGCVDIASQLLAWQGKYGNGFDVILGGGRTNFLPATMTDPEYPNEKGVRLDGRNLVDEWQAAGPNRTAVIDRAGFNAFNWNSDGQILNSSSRRICSTNSTARRTGRVSPRSRR